MQEQKRRKPDCGEIQANGEEPGRLCLHKFFICKESDCVEKSGDTQGSKSTDWIIRVSANQNSNPDAASGENKHRELVAIGYQGYPENPQIPEDSEDSEPESRNLATSFPYITTLCGSHGEVALDDEKDS